MGQQCCDACHAMKEDLRNETLLAKTTLASVLNYKPCKELTLTFSEVPPSSRPTFSAAPGAALPTTATHSVRSNTGENTNQWLDMTLHMT